MSTLQINSQAYNEKYLGLPTMLGRSKNATFKTIKDKIWKKKFKDGRKSFFQQRERKCLSKLWPSLSLPIYSMNCFLLSDSLCQDISQLLAKFLWGSNTNRNKIHWASWEKLSLCESLRRLGQRIKIIRPLSLLAKQSWRVLNFEDPLLHKIFKAPYFPNESFLDADIGHAPP